MLTKDTRIYADALKLDELGILQYILSVEITDLILALEPNPVFFHCHAYEIPAASAVNHIGFLERDRWHRDFVEPNMRSENDANAFGIFIYFTDVNTEANAHSTLFQNIL
jgi:hypothetical protein